MEARSINRYIGTSPRKMRLVIDLIRGRKVNEALHILHFSPKHASKVAEKVLRSAVANLQNKEDGGRLDPEDMVVKTVTVDGGMMMKRISPSSYPRPWWKRWRARNGRGPDALHGHAARRPHRLQKPLPRALRVPARNRNRSNSRRNFGTENASGRASPRHHPFLGLELV